MDGPGQAGDQAGMQSQDSGLSGKSYALVFFSILGYLRSC